MPQVTLAIPAQKGRNHTHGSTETVYWKDREFLTDVLIAHIEWIEDNIGPVGKIVDLLSEISYQETINWGMISSRWNVFHRIFEKNSDRDALDNMGPWIQAVLNKQIALEELVLDTFYEIPNFITEDRIAFEGRIGASALDVTRGYE